jgi:hypothetical protein
MPLHALTKVGHACLTKPNDRLKDSALPTDFVYPTTQEGQNTRNEVCGILAQKRIKKAQSNKTKSGRGP